MVGETGKKFAFFALICMILSLNFASASFTIGNPSNSITDSYSPDSTLNGWINISLSNQAADSLIESSLGGSIKLIDLLQNNSNSGFVYTCNPISCDSNYLATGESPSKTLSMTENSSSIIGMEIFGNYITSISSFSMKISSNNPESQKVPLMIDILNDGQTEWQSYAASGNFLPSSENFGCFEVAQGSANIVYGVQNQYCEKISLTRTPEVELGAYVQGNTASNFLLKITSTDGSKYGSCTASALGMGSKERISCIPSNFKVENEGDYFVCISASSNPSDSNYYRINYEQTDPVCGFTGVYQNSYTYDFEVFARQEEYAASTNLTLNNEELSSIDSPVTNIEQYIKNYLSNKYNNNCSKGCVIPIKFSSGVNQQVSITDASMTYSSGISTTINGLFDVQETPAQISSGFQKLYLDDAGFKIPSEYGNHSISITLNGNSLASKQISVIGETSGIKSLTPTKTAVKYPTNFTVLLNASGNVSEYYWEFGDGGKQITAKNSVVYTYNTIGNYALKVTLVSNAENVSKIFNITVSSASDIIPIIIEEEQGGIDSIKNQSVNFSLFEQNSVNKALNIDAIQTNLTKLKNSFSNASSEEQFGAILSELLTIKMPLGIAKTASSVGIAFYPDSNNIDMGTLSQITGESYDSSKESQYKQAILSWDEGNINTVLIYSEISSLYSDYQDPLVKTFDITVTKSSSDDAYLIVKDMDGMLFKDDYTQRKINGYYYMELNTGDNHFVFSTTEDVNFVNIPMFISPKISSLSLTSGEQIGEVEKQTNKWIMFGVIIFIVLVVVAIVWILLQIWYKRKYEDHLFKNKNNLYNLITYIKNSKEKGMKEKEISEKLRKAGWNSEQTSYAMKKYAGKKIGMPGISLEKFGKRDKKKKITG